MLERTRQFFVRWLGESGAEAEMENSGGHWRKCAFFYPNELDRAIADAYLAGKENQFTGGPAQYLMYRTRDFIGSPDWPSAWNAKPEKVQAWAMRSQRNTTRSANLHD